MKILAVAKLLVTHRYLALALRLYIAGLFIYAGMYKINYTAEFSETIASYRMVPYWAVNFMAVVMPWIELICGILLVCGIRVRSAIVIVGFFLVLFTVGIAINLLWNAPISCGCFHTLGDAISWRTLVRDLIWVAMALQVYFYDSIFHMEKKFDTFIKEI
ncbi:MauE/DoxX family redox-associated membrane protein [Desulfobacula sp.]|uniref:MauE/DoxX family redox-associated membrane protein n=1 Tax=Desulfobacula sp. TaxID=2593537 RepID=UPI00261720B7|nr:MauE/DoxX family redox-associated membrane protein [Desulfobacula sp.]